MRRLLLAGLLAMAAWGQNTAIYPGTTASCSDLLLGSNLQSTTTTLSSAIAAGDTAIPVGSTTGVSIPATCATAITIDAERIKVCSKTATSYTACTGGRGFDGSTAASHSSGATVRLNIIAWYHNQLEAEVNAVEADLALKLPSQGQKDALPGTSGTPGATNKYVTDADARNTNARAPSGTAGGDLSGSYPNPSVANLPTDVPMAGDLLATTIASPATPAASKARLYVDSTSKNIAVKDDAGTVKHGVQTKAAVANNFLTAIDDAGAVTVARPACADLSNAAASCSTDATNAGNITAGNLPAAQNTTLVNTADQGYFQGVTIFPSTSTGTTGTFTLNVVKVWQFVLPFRATIGKIVYEVTTAGTGTNHLQLALWKADLATVAVQTGVLTGTNVSSVAVQTVTVTAVTLDPGVYNLAVTTDDTVLILRSILVGSGAINSLNNQTVKKMGTCANNGSAGALPTSCGTVTASTAVPPLVTFER